MIFNQMYLKNSFRMFAYTIMTLIILQFESNAKSECGKYLSETNLVQTTGYHPFDKFFEVLSDITLNRKVVYQNNHFNLRILSKKIRRNSFNPEQIKTDSIELINKYVEMYKGMGFHPQSYLQVLVGTYPNALGVFDTDFKQRWYTLNPMKFKPFLGGPCLANFACFFGVRDIFGNFNLFIGDTARQGYPNIPKFLYLPAETEHPLYNDFVVAHELAHNTEDSESHTDLIWREARADFLAYIATGTDQLFIKSGIERAELNSNGEVKYHVNQLVRSLANPSIFHSSEVIPQYRSYHENSEILSSLLFQISKKIGDQKALDFIKWMDGIKDDLRIIDLKDASTRVDTANSITIDFNTNENLNEIRAAIIKQLKKTADLVRTFFNAGNFSPSEVEFINDLLNDRGI